MKDLTFDFPPRTRRLSLAASYLILGLGLATLFSFTAFWSTYSGFEAFDDEGYMLMILKQLARGKILYDQIFANYGPAGFLPRLAIVKLLHLPVNHDVGRGISAALWVLTALTFGGAALKLTRSVAWGIAGATLMFRTLATIHGQAGHPQDLCELYFAIGLLAITFVGPDYRKLPLVCIGVVGGLLLMTKINLGIFYIAAIGVASIFSLRPSPFRTLSLKIIWVLLIAMPVILTRGHILSEPGVQTFVLCFILATACWLLTLQDKAVLSRMPVGRMVILHLSLGVTTIAVIALTLLLKSSAHAMLSSLVFLPLRVAEMFTLYWIPDALIVATFVALATMAVILKFSTLNPRQAKCMDALVHFSRIAFSLLLIGMILIFGGLNLIDMYVPAFLWLFLLPSNGQSAGFGLILLSGMSLLQILTTFPVNGVQSSFALMGPILIALWSLKQEISYFNDRFAPQKIKASIGRIVLLAISGSSLTYVTSLAVFSRSFYNALIPIRLPGSELIHVHHSDLVRIYAVVSNLKANADAFITMPGLNSFYFWTQMDPPPGVSLSTSFRFLTDQQLVDNVNALKPYPRACILLDLHEAGFWQVTDNDLQSPLFGMITDAYRPVLRSREWSILLRHDRSTVQAVTTFGKMSTRPIPLQGTIDLDRRTSN